MSDQIISRADLSKLEKRMDDLNAATIQINKVMSEIHQEVNETNQGLYELAEQFKSMMIRQEKQAALQQASTELVRVRQEIESNYGNYKVIRETMLGVLQATDLALVKKATISRVTEELMLSTPKYWLAPCLVAIAAWIGNDRELADRAIAEAVKRDEERTAITMALICRRNNRVQTCYEWLSIYFSHQNSANFSEGTFAYIDAYLNGIFGPDEKHMCDDYITKWMNEIRGNSSTIEQQQEQTWKEYCHRFCKDTSSLYPDLDSSVREQNNISEYVGRILSVDSISENFTDINNAYVDHEGLKNKIDKNLIQLISRYNEDEEPLRKEEEYLKAVKLYEGDKNKAKEMIIAKEMARKQQTLNLVEQMSNVILTDEDVAPSQKKTAVLLLSGYIRKGFDSYIHEKKEEFPQQITIDMNGWSGTTTDGSNIDQLCSEYDQFMQNNCVQAVEATKNNGSLTKKIGGILIAILGLIGLTSLPAIIGFLLIVAGVALTIGAFKSDRASTERAIQLQKDYESKTAIGKQKIGNIITQWNEVKTVVNDFESNPVKEII